MNDTSDTRERLLRSALGMFARSGYHGTPIRDITREAGANLGAVTYHFGSKEQLYAEVLRSVLGPLKQRMSAASSRDGAPLERIEFVVRGFFEHIRAHPEMPALMVRELASGREPHPVILATFSEMLPQLAALIAAGQQDGSIRHGDPVLLALSTVAQPVYLNLARPVISRIVGVDPQSAESGDRLVDHVVATVLALLRNPAP